MHALTPLLGWRELIPMNMTTVTVNFPMAVKRAVVSLWLAHVLRQMVVEQRCFDSLFIVWCLCVTLLPLY